MNQEIDSSDEQSIKGRFPANRYAVFLLIGAAGLACDLITKRVVFERYFDPSGRSEVQWWLDGVLGIETSTNGGALFGMFQGGSFWLALLSTVALLGILYWLFARGAAKNLFLTVSLALVTGGILGNLYDRLGLGHLAEYGDNVKYHVRDWIHFRIEGVPFLDPWPNFNVADSLLVCGAAMLFLFAFVGLDSAQHDDSSRSQQVDPQGK